MDIDILAVVSLIVSSILSVVALVISLYTFKITSAMQEYANIDTLYQSLLCTGIDHPQFRDPAMTQDYKRSFSKDKSQDKNDASDDKIPTVLQYETYALNIWNCCETICDDFLNYDEVINKNLIAKDKKSEPDWKSWYPALVVEAKLHGNWFKENKSKFELKFVQAIELLIEQINTENKKPKE